MKRVLTTIVVVTAIFVSCKKDKPKTAPSVTTAALTNITTTGATAGGTITSDGNSPISASGVVLSRVHSIPTLTDTVLATTTTSGSFTVNISNLEFGRTYYIRAYATNAIGTTYGDVVTLNTTTDNTKVRFTYNGQEVVYGVITSSVTSKKWMDRNLGASRTALYSTDSLAYGDLFQWGRLADGHQLRTSTTTNVLSATDVPGHSNFIVPSAAPRDWRSTQNDNLWQGSSGINNPCPTGWHVPTKADWDAETGMSDSTSAYSRLKLTLAGYRSRLSGSVINFGPNGQYAYWSTTVSGTSSYEWIGGSAPGVSDRALGGSIRCVKD